jgi:hypothetical protein
MEGGGAGSWSSGMRERREIPKIERVEAVVLILGEMLEVLQCS